MRFQRFIHFFLQIFINGKHQRLAGLRLFGDLGGNNNAIGIAGDGFHAVAAAQRTFVYSFQACLTNDIAHGIAGTAQGIVIRLPLFGGDFAHATKHRRDQRSIGIIANGGVHDLSAVQAQALLFDGGHGFIRNIFGQHKVVVVGKFLQLHLVTNTAQNASPCGIVILQTVFLHHLGHHFVCRGILLQPHGAFERLQAFLLLLIRFLGNKAVAAVFIGAADHHGIVPAFPIAL